MINRCKLKEIYTYHILSTNIFLFLLFIAVLGLPCCLEAFSSCGAQTPHKLLLLQSIGSRACKLSSCGS